MPLYFGLCFACSQRNIGFCTSEDFLLSGRGNKVWRTNGSPAGPPNFVRPECRTSSLVRERLLRWLLCLARFLLFDYSWTSTLHCMPTCLRLLLFPSIDTCCMSTFLPSKVPWNHCPFKWSFNGLQLCLLCRMRS